MSLFHSALGSRRPTSFPSLAQTGLLVQTTDDYTNFAVSFTGVGRAPGSSVLELEYSNDNSTNWTQFATFSIDFPRAGSTYAGGGGEYSTNFSALTYAVGRGFRGRWVNSILNYTGSYTSLGVTSVARYGMTTPVAPLFGSGDVVFEDPVLVSGSTWRQPVTVNITEKVITGAYYNERIELYVEYTKRKGAVFTPATATYMVATVWWNTLNAYHAYATIASLFTFDTNLVDDYTIDLVEARYTVLGSGTFGTGVLRTWGADPAY